MHKWESWDSERLITLPKSQHTCWTPKLKPGLPDAEAPSQWEWPRLKGEMGEGAAWTEQDRNPQTTASSWASNWKNLARRLLEIVWTFCSPPHLLDRKKIHETWKTKTQPYNIHGVPSLYHARTVGLLNQTPKLKTTKHLGRWQKETWRLPRDTSETQSILVSCKIKGRGALMVRRCKPCKEGSREVKSADTADGETDTPEATISSF